MSKVFGEGVAVFTKDSVITTDDDAKKQAIVDEWTDKLAKNMAEHTHWNDSFRNIGRMIQI